MRKICDVTKEKFVPSEIRVMYLNSEDIVTYSLTEELALGRQTDPMALEEDEEDEND